MAEFVSLEQIRDAIEGRVNLPNNALLVTLDDGLREQYDLALPVIDQLGIPAAFFVNTAPLLVAGITQMHKNHMLRSQLSPADMMLMLKRYSGPLNIMLEDCIEDSRAQAQYAYDTLETARLKYLLNFSLAPKDADQLISACFADVFGDEVVISRNLYMSIDQLRSLAQRGYLGSHSHDHLPLGMLSFPEIDFQIHNSFTLLRTWTGCAIFAMSYPYGGYEACPDKVSDVASAVDVAFAFTMERAGNWTLKDPLHLARYDTNDLPGGKHSKYQLETLFNSVPYRTWHLTGANS